MNRSGTSRRATGRPPVFPGAYVQACGVSLHPAQVERLTATARRRGTTFSGLVREALTEWEQANGLVPAE